MNHAIHLTSPNDVATSTLGTPIGRRRSRQSQMKNTFFSPAGQRLIASNTNRLVQFSRGHLGPRGETALDTAHQTELTTLRKPLPTNQLNFAHFISRRTVLWRKWNTPARSHVECSQHSGSRSGTPQECDFRNSVVNATESYSHRNSF